MWDFGRAELLEPEAIGEPGKRTFRLRVMSGGDAASLWLEKEQLAALTVAIRGILEQTGETPDEPEPAPTAFPDQPQVDFKIGRLGIGYDDGQRMVVIFAYEMEEADKEDAPPAFSCQASLGQCDRFADRAEEVISGGRPLCILCGGPIDTQGHDCPTRNGHSKRPIALEE
jgi:uncharacterized repeat protein (TIGR03847 family)